MNVEKLRWWRAVGHNGGEGSIRALTQTPGSLAAALVWAHELFASTGGQALKLVEVDERGLLLKGGISVEIKCRAD